MKNALWVAAAVTVASGAQAATFEHAGWLVPDAPYRSMLGQRPRSLDQMSREQLQRERRRLDEETPGLAGPIVLIAVGGGSMLVGTYYLVGSAIASVNLGASTMFLVAGLVTAIGGVGSVIVGILWLVARLNERVGYRERIKAIDARLDAIYDSRGRPNEYSPPPMVPPPPPVPPPSSLREVPAPQMVVARF